MIPSQGLPLRQRTEREAEGIDAQHPRGSLIAKCKQGRESAAAQQESKKSNQ